MCGRGWQQYIKWREAASAEANKRAKNVPTPELTHPFLIDENSEKADQLVQMIKNYTPKGVSGRRNGEAEIPWNTQLTNDIVPLLRDFLLDLGTYLISGIPHERQA